MIRDINDVFNLVHTINVQALQSIKIECDKNSNIREFVNLIIQNGRYGDFRNPISEQLITFTHDLGYDLQINECHSSSFFTNLDGFIGNFFLDDAYFNFKKSENFFGEWKCFGDDNNGTQDPKIMIQRAKDNIDIYKNGEIEIKRMKQNRLKQILED